MSKLHFWNTKTGKHKDLEEMSHCYFVNNKSHTECPGIKPLLFYPEEEASTFQIVATYLKSNATIHHKTCFFALLLQPVLLANAPVPYTMHPYPSQSC